MVTQGGYDVGFIYIALVPPFIESDEKFEIQSKLLSAKTKATEYLHQVFDKSLSDAKVEIAFKSDDKQRNEFREHLLNILNKPTNQQKKYHTDKLAYSLFEQTDDRNGTGLLVIMEGLKASTSRIVIARFKGEDGLYNNSSTFDIDYVPEVFTKKSKHYKLAVFEDIISKTSFWKGFAVDKQTSASQYKQISEFWVSDFLQCRPAITAYQGTSQFSKVMKSILSKSSDIVEQEAIINAISTLKSKKVQNISIKQFCIDYLPLELFDKVKNEVKDEQYFESSFPIDLDVYKKEFGKMVVSLANGITAFIPTNSYEKYVVEETADNGDKQITIKGKLQSKKLNNIATSKISNQNA